MAITLKYMALTLKERALAGQLSGLIGGGKEVTDAIKNGIDIIINKYPDVKNNSKPNPSSKPHESVDTKQLEQEIKSTEEKKSQLEKEIESLKAKKAAEKDDSPVEPSKLKELEKVTSKVKDLQTLEKLCGYSKDLEQNKSTYDKSCNKLLTNLTDGLEKFLGYQETSKGYTGEGIVYSDLDRLCDGVMAFLHGVLDNIKPKLGQHNDKIREAIESLITHKHSGKNGFNTAIGAVVEGVKGYNEGVKASNRKVDEKFKSGVSAILPRDQEGNAGRVEEAKREVEAKLAECQEKAAEFNDAFNLATNSEMKNAVNDLNPKLHERVVVAAKAVKHESDRLTELSTKESEELRETEAKIRSVLQGLNDSVNRSITTQVKSLVKFLCSEVSAIKDKLVSISEMLGNYVEQLKRWISDADAFFQKVMKDVHKIEKNAPGILNQMNVEDKAKELQKKGEELHRRFEYAKNEVGHLVDAAKKKEVNELDTWSAAAGKVVGAAQGKCYLILGKSEIKDSGEPEIKKQADALQKKATDL
ncbi:hypothetical protein BOVATA_046390 [Babesia ovata]|uniref:Extracellular matrix-binding ebh n=1 Tax=Babesia ovata TaxID=189622 RepID=A0A2H6KJI1_9APIC|nr:uncharacterized protein BOVATA_046390 [Babesia ovata]GBE63146.1 hypothetical protein BOVATA_046390 [Babesia ovata]